MSPFKVNQSLLEAFSSPISLPQADVRMSADSGGYMGNSAFP